MTTPEIDAARDALTRAEAEVDSLRAKLRAELADQDARGFGEAHPERLRWADGVAEARARYPKGRSFGDAASEGDAAEGSPASGATAGRKEARRRYGRDS